jgi:dTDP-4-dehydrorhamnose 3,5-epimerase
MYSKSDAEVEQSTFGIGPKSLPAVFRLFYFQAVHHAVAIRFLDYTGIPFARNRRLRWRMVGERTAVSAGREIKKSEALELILPVCEKGVGEIIGQINSPRLIDGVRLAPLSVFPDDRGYFLEVQRLGQGLAKGFPAVSTQVSAALSYPGSIKAFHYHLQQTDCWTPVKGLLQVALVDLRRGSPTFGVRNTLYAGPLRPWQILIPPGVGHGYKVIGTEEALLVYMTDQFYNSEDEGRIPFNDLSIQYDWETQHK